MVLPALGIVCHTLPSIQMKIRTKLFASVLFSPQLLMFMSWSSIFLSSPVQFNCWLLRPAFPSCCHSCSQRISQPHWNTTSSKCLEKGKSINTNWSFKNHQRWYTLHFHAQTQGMLIRMLSYLILIIHEEKLEASKHPFCNPRWRRASIAPLSWNQ